MRNPADCAHLLVPIRGDPMALLLSERISEVLMSNVEGEQSQKVGSLTGLRTAKHIEIAMGAN